MSTVREQKMWGQGTGQRSEVRGQGMRDAGGGTDGELGAQGRWGMKRGASARRLVWIQVACLGPFIRAEV